MTTIWVDGIRNASVPADDRGLQYGDGVFTTALVWNEQIVWEASHIERLLRDAATLKIPSPAPEQLRSAWRTAAAGCSRGVLKTILTRGSGPRGYSPPHQTQPRQILYLDAMPTHDIRRWTQGIHLHSATVPLAIQPTLAGAKHLNRLEQVLARAEAPVADADELLFCDTQGHMICGGMTNVFWVKDGILHSPQLDGAGVLGIGREQLLKRARSDGISVQFGRYTLSMLAQADEMFVTNAVIGLWPVTQWQSQRWSVGLLTKRLAASLDHPLAAQVNHV